MSRYHSHYSQDKVSSSNGAPAYQKDGGRKLDDTETSPPYNANIGPGGPDMNRVGFPRVKAYMKAKMSPFIDAQSGAVPQGGTLPAAVPPAFASNVPGESQQNMTSASDISGFRSGSFRR